MWDRIIDWFGDKLEKRELVRSFNKHAKQAFQNGKFPVQMKAKIVLGNKENKHSHSDFFSGFRISIVSHGFVSIEECYLIGTIIYSNQKLVRQLMRCGFDTLEIFGNNAAHGGYEIKLNRLLLE